MTLQLSGSLSLDQISRELVLVQPIFRVQMDQQRFRMLAQKLTGSFSFDDFYGRSCERKIFQTLAWSNNRYGYAGLDCALVSNPAQGGLLQGIDKQFLPAGSNGIVRQYDPYFRGAKINAILADYAQNRFSVAIEGNRGQDFFYGLLFNGVEYYAGQASSYAFGGFVSLWHWNFTPTIVPNQEIGVDFFY